MVVFFPHETICIELKKVAISYRHIFSYAFILANDCSFDTSVLPKANCITTFTARSSMSGLVWSTKKKKEKEKKQTNSTITVTRVLNEIDHVNNMNLYI